MDKKKKGKLSYAKYGYLFILPFFVAYAVLTLIPQIMTVYNSFFENYMDGLRHVGPKFVGLKNYLVLFTKDQSGSTILRFFLNTIILWVYGAIPQIGIALLLAVFFTSTKLNLRGQGFFKSVIYMPNLIMASAFSMLFFTIFSPVGPVNQILISSGLVDQFVDFFFIKASVRTLVAFMNFLMWFGNTTILLMAGIQGIDECLFEAARIDGASSLQTFFRVTLPMLMPQITYVVINAMIGGFQMFDVPQVLTKGLGSPNRSTMTVVMLLNNYLGTSKNYGMAGSVSVVLFIVTGILSMFVYRSMVKQYKK